MPIKTIKGISSFEENPVHNSQKMDFQKTVQPFIA